MRMIRRCGWCEALDEIDECDALGACKLEQIRTADAVERTLCHAKRVEIEERGTATCEGCGKPDCILNQVKIY